MRAEQAYYTALNSYEDDFKKIIDGDNGYNGENPLDPFNNASTIAANDDARTELLTVVGLSDATRANPTNGTQMNRVANSKSSNTQVSALQAKALAAVQAQRAMNTARTTLQQTAGYNTTMNAVALGNGATALGLRTTALGAMAAANLEDGVALGSTSVTTVDKGEVGFDASQDFAAGDSRTNNYAALTNDTNHVRTSTLAGVSVGNANNTRQINHLAAGTADTDAVNVAQLKSVNLGFTGNDGKGDVRLYDQRMNILGDTDTFISTKADNHTVTITAKQGTLATSDGKVTVPDADNNGLATADGVANAINNSYWTATATATSLGEMSGASNEQVNPGDTVTFEADKNIKITQDAGKFTIATQENVAFTTMKVGAPETYTDSSNNPVINIDGSYYPVGSVKLSDGQVYPAGTVINEDGNAVDATGQVVTPLTAIPASNVTTVNPQVNFTRTDATPATNNVDANGDVEEPSTALNIASTDGKATQLTGVGSVLNTTPIDTNPNGTATTGTDRPNLIDLRLDATTGKSGLAPSVLQSAATVGDLANMGWIVSATGNTYRDTVKNANEVNFVGSGLARVTGETVDGVRTITVDVDAQRMTESAQLPVVYVTATGEKVTSIDGNFYPEGSVKLSDGNVYPAGTTLVNNQPQTPAGDAATAVNPIGKNTIKASLNSGANQTEPTTLTNVANNLPTVNDTDKKAYSVDGKEIAGATNVAAPISAADAANLLKDKNDDGSANVNFRGNNAATVSDVLNAGWNLQNNGASKDFVKPYDTVNFVDGVNTRAVVTTNDDGTSSDVTFNVSGLPISYTTSDGTLVSKIGDSYYRVNENGVPVDAAGNVATGKNAAGQYIDANGAVIGPVDTTATPISTNLVNPNVSNTTAEPNKQTTTATQLGNVANGGTTFAAVTDASGTELAKANDGLWYPKDQVNPNGTTAAGATAATPRPIPAGNPIDGRGGLVDFSKSTPTNAATVGDLQNMGWVISAESVTGETVNEGDDPNRYVDQVRNSNRVDFRGGTGVSVTGRTLGDGTREITVSLKEGRVTNNVIITRPDGTQVKAVIEDGKYYVPDPTTGKADKTQEVTFNTDNGDVVNNDGDAYVTGNTVATAIQQSGWNIGIEKPANVKGEFKSDDTRYEKVNPNDSVRYVDGDNTNVALATDGPLDRIGARETATYVKVDINRDLNIDSVNLGGPTVDTNGNKIVKVGDNYYPVHIVEHDGKIYPPGSLIHDGQVYAPGNMVINGQVYPLGSVEINGQVYPAGTRLDPVTQQPVDQSGTAVQPVLAVTTPATEQAPVPTADIAPGKEGAVTVKDKAGNDVVTLTTQEGTSTVAVKGENGKDGVAIASDKDGNGTIALHGKDDANASISVVNGPKGVDPTDSEKARITYTTNVPILDAQGNPVMEPVLDDNGQPVNGADGQPLQRAKMETKREQVATLNDGLTFTGNNETLNHHKLNTTVKIIGEGVDKSASDAFQSAAGNINVKADGTDTLTVQLSKNLVGLNSASFTGANGNTSTMTNNGITVVPNGVNPATDPSKVISFGADTTNADGTVKPGISAGGQVISNVAAGVNDTDAVNVAQLRDLTGNVSNINNQFVSMNQQLAGVNSRMNRLGAQAAAMGALKNLQYDPLEPTQVMAGVGYYKGESALALGVAHFKNESTMFHAGATLGGHSDEMMANAGVTWKFGSRSDETAVQDTFRQGPISASYTLQDKVAALEAQNQVQKDEINALKAQLAEVLQYVKRG